MRPSVVLTCVLLLAQGCSFSSSRSASLTIALHPESAPRELSGLFTLPSFAGPNTVNDFDCFGVNVTGPGISSDPTRLHDCTVLDNMHGRGVGIISPESVTYGTPLKMLIPSGPDRVISVFGIYPPTRECGATTESTQQVYFLGEATRSIYASTAVEVPITFNVSQSPSLTCTGGSSGPYTELIDGTQGQAGYSGCVSQAAISATAPAPGTLAATAFTTAENSLVQAQDSSFATHACTGAGIQVMAQEFMFAISPATASAYYSQVTISWNGSAGYYFPGGGTCGAGAPTTGGGQVDVWNETTGQWENMATPAIGATGFTQTFSPILDYIHLGAVHVRVVSTGTSAACMQVSTDFVSASFQ